MKIKNSTSWNDWMLRRMIKWCCSKLEMPLHSIKVCVFRNSRATWGGCARSWKKQITVCVTDKESEFPASCSTHAAGEKFADRIECLVAVTAHELYHIAAHCVSEHRQRTRGYGKGQGSSERVTCAEEMRVLNLFRQDRECLLTEWQIAPLINPKLSLTEKRAVKAKIDLARWTRKLKLAQTKVSKLKRRVKYYQD